MIGKPAVARVENARDAGQFGCGIERPSPPYLPRQKKHGFSAAVNFALDRCHAHFSKQFFRRQIQEGLHAWVLQAREAETELFKGATEAPGECGADRAIAVEEHPAAGGAASFRISYF